MRLRKHARIAGVVIVFLAVVMSAAYGQRRGRWEFLGAAHVDGNVDHDNIPVSMREGRFRAVQLRVRGGAVEFNRVVIHYGDGEPERIDVRYRIKDGGETRAIDLRGHTRYIRSVELWYSRGGWRRRPEVQLYGMR